MNVALATLGLLALGCVLQPLAGCSKSAAPVSADRGVSQAASAAAPGSACERHLLEAQDVGAVLSLPITGSRPIPGDSQSCEFTTASFPAIIVSVRPGIGRTTLDAWKAGKMPLESRPLAGVGDAAVWLEPLHEVIAQRDALLCDIQVRGSGGDLALSAADLPAAVGVLCNKIFSAH